MPAPRPIVPVTLAYAAGCVLAIWSGAAPWVGLSVAVIGCAAALSGFAGGQRSWTAILTAAALAGVARTAAVQTPGPWDVSRLAARRTPVVLQGWICEDPVIGQRRVQLRVRVTEIISAHRDTPVTGTVALNLLSPAAAMLVRSGGSLEYGQTLRFGGRVSRPSGERNPGEFSHERYLARHGVFSVVWVDSPGAVSLLDIPGGPRIMRTAREVGTALRRFFSERLPVQEAGLVSGMLLGSYTLVPEDLVEDFTRSGTLHLLAASGFNCALIVAIFWHGLLRRFRAPRIPALLLVLGLVGFYALMAGAKPSIVRAGVGAALFLSALMMGRPASMLAVLFGTALIILLAAPLSIADAGFQLSFAAVAGIISLAPAAQAWISREPEVEGREPLRRRIRRHLADVALVTCAATLATLPILAHYFNRVSIVSLPANLAVAALAEWLFVAGTALALLFWIPGVDWLLTKVVFFLASGVVKVVHLMGGLPFAQINVPSPPLAWIAVYYALFAAVVIRLRSARTARPAAVPPVYAPR